MPDLDDLTDADLEQERLAAAAAAERVRRDLAAWPEYVTGETF